MAILPLSTGLPSSEGAEEEVRPLTQMANTFDPLIPSQAPASLRLQRNGMNLQAVRVKLERLRVGDGRIWIADAAWVEEVPALPVKLPSGEFEVYAYQWQHRLGEINVCAAIVVSPRAPTKSN